MNNKVQLKIKIRSYVLIYLILCY